ncbi:MAG TPA: hypothetical protein VE646_04170 [Actinomycetota bacterium]|jgi:hypothetical protein|nr:hypothetical protein [Actinomycetota bacterium]
MFGHVAAAISSLGPPGRAAAAGTQWSPGGPFVIAAYVATGLSLVLMGVYAFAPLVRHRRRIRRARRSDRRGMSDVRDDAVERELNDLLSDQSLVREARRTVWASRRGGQDPSRHHHGPHGRRPPPDGEGHPS